MAARLSARAIDFTLPPPNALTVESEVTQRWGGMGFVEQADMMQVHTPAGTRMTAANRCTLEPACDGDEVVLPEDARLLACQLGLVPRAEPGLLEPHAIAPYLLPPFDRIAAFQRRNRHALRFQLDVATIREIVGY